MARDTQSVKEKLTIAKRQNAARRIDDTTRIAYNEYPITSMLLYSDWNEKWAMVMQLRRSLSSFWIVKLIF